MTLPRRVSSETLDHLAENDPRAIRSRRDLQRVHKVMRTRSILLKALREAATQVGDIRGKASSAPLRLIELGAGDATLMLGVAKKLARQWPHVHLTLLDRQIVISQQTLQEFRGLGWQVEVLVMDITDWINEPATEHWDIALANLFLHHFDGAPLQQLIETIAQRSDAFIACEPRRSRFALVGSHLIGLLGVNEVTREDAVLSVEAGFIGDELSQLWPAAAEWQLVEHAAGLFSHCLLAAKTGRKHENQL